MKKICMVVNEQECAPMTHSVHRIESYAMEEVA